MPSIAIITDSDASLPADIAARHHIRQVPIGIHFGEEQFEAGVDINDQRLFKRIDREQRIPTTAAPSAGKFAEAFEAAFKEGADAVLCFCVSSAISGTYGAAKAACDLLPGRDITIVDTLSLTMGQGFMVLAAVEARAEGATKEEMVRRAEQVQKRTVLFGALSTLKYLAMSGRVGHLAAGMASILNIKPILTLRDGKLDMLERVRTQGKAWGRVIELSQQAVGQRGIDKMAILHARADAEAVQFEQLLRAQLPCPETILFAELTPGLSVHTGAGFVGVVLTTRNG